MAGPGPGLELHPVLLDRARRRAADGAERFAILQPWVGCPWGCQQGRALPLRMYGCMCCALGIRLSHVAVPSIRSPYLPATPWPGSSAKKKGDIRVSSRSCCCESADGWSRSAPVWSPEADGAAGARCWVSIAVGAFIQSWTRLGWKGP